MQVQVVIRSLSEVDEEERFEALLDKFVSCCDSMAAGAYAGQGRVADEARGARYAVERMMSGETTNRPGTARRRRLERQLQRPHSSSSTSGSATCCQDRTSSVSRQFLTLRTPTTPLLIDAQGNYATRLAWCSG